MKRPIVITLLIVALALVCVGIGSVIYFTNGFQTNNLFDKLNISSVLEESKTLKVDAEKPITLTVNDAAGDVTVTGGDVTTVQVKAVKTAYDTTQARADEEVKTVKYTVEQSGNNITIKYEIPKSMNFSNNINTMDFIVTVPAETAVQTNMGSGDANISDVKGAVDIDNSFGKVNVQNIEGALTVSNNSGDIEATGIKAGSDNIELNSDFGNITLEQANAADITFDSNSGKVSLKDVNATGDFYSKSDFGDTKFENGSAASINIESNSGKVELIKLKVNKLIKVDDDFGDIELTQATAASYDLHTNSGTITVDGVKGNLKASTDFGNIEVTNAQSATLDLDTNSGSIEFDGSLGAGPHLVNSDFGNITLALPADSKLNVDLKTDFGNIKSDLPVTITVTDGSSGDKEQIVGAVNGGGAQLTVKTNSGNIDINAMK
jgi:DUF4097 and DUF4098 domain-containing protein YvlB